MPPPAKSRAAGLKSAFPTSAGKRPGPEDWHVVRDPHKFGMAGGAAVAGLFLCWRFYAQVEGEVTEPLPLAVGTVFTFVVAYLAVGLFAKLVFAIADHELAPPEEAEAPPAPHAPETEAEAESDVAGTEAYPESYPEETSTP